MKEQFSAELGIFPPPQRQQDSELHSQLSSIQKFDSIHIYRSNDYLRLIVEKAADVSDGAIKDKPGQYNF